MGHWHGLTKLHLHTDATLVIMDNATLSLGKALREFKTKTCSMFATQELQREVNAWNHKQAKKSTVVKASHKPKEFNMNTYKYHALGDITNTIREYGTTESYSTEPVSFVHDYPGPHYISCLWQGELEHRTLKSRYKRTSKKNYLKQLTQIECHQAHIHQICRRLNAGKTSHHNEVEYASLLMSQYCIGKSQNEPVILPIFLHENCGDPAVKVSIHVNGLVSPF